MSASFEIIALEILTGSFQMILNVLKVIVPLMIVIEILTVYQVMKILAAKLAGVSRLLGMTPLSILPLLVTTIMGVSYGAGTLLEMNRVNPIPKRDLVLMAIFFFICHAIIESTAIWVAAGADLIMISAGRLFFAFLFTVIASRLPFIKAIGNDVDC
ncbi:MAG: hypothetical protein CVU86_02240 [Firmicutes bacterium HGW-Firmicutes-11]|jgi:hypothetical protein|nr:MAG: hypothetical protein CVU86_02240 [Firmicutes bacterium HGW-Firmicutes-11]